MGRRVRVFMTTHDDFKVEIFTGTLEPGVPWMLWHRVRPDDKAVDLPPIFGVEYIDEEEN